MIHRDSVIRILLGPLACAVVLGFAVRTIVRVYSIPSRSMQPTLTVGDQIAVTPYWRDTQPQRGDVIVFRSPADRSEFLVKRVVAVPGDRIASEKGFVTIGGHAVAEPYLFAPASTAFVAPQTIPPDCYFVMGDYRAVSLDSRSWGVLPRDLIVGRARLILWSSTTSAPIAFASSNASAPSAFRSGRFRMFVPIE